MNVGPSSTPEEVFVAPFTGIYVFSIVLGEGGSATLRRADDMIVGFTGPAGTQGSGHFYLLAQESIAYEGASALLAGARIGNEL